MEAVDGEGVAEENLQFDVDSDDDIDSLDSEKKRSKARITLVEPEKVDVGPPKPDLSDEDLHKLIGYVKKITTLFDLRDQDWNEECEKVIMEFFIDTTQLILSVFFIKTNLQCVLGFPTDPADDLTYFLRKPLQILTPATFHDSIIFGTVDDDIAGCLLKIIENIYAPIIFDNNSWPDNVQSELRNTLHNFLALFTDIQYKIMGLTVIYIPAANTIKSASIDEAARDKELVKRLETIVLQWIKQIRICLADQKQSPVNELLCPEDEYDFWTYRYENLAGLSYQFQNKNLKYITDILKATHSGYIPQFVKFVEELDQNMKEAKSNIEFIQILIEPCKEIKNIDTPEEIPKKIPHVLSLIRVIWMYSPHYNSKEKITTLCKGLSNEVILCCTRYIDLNTVLHGKTRMGIKMLETCIECCTKYKFLYIMVAEAHTENSPKPWLLNNAHVFNHVDSFIQRCYDMIEVCESMITFGRFDENEEIPKPLFGGAKGTTFEEMAEKVETMFNESLNEIIKNQNKILDIQAEEWQEEILKFRNGMKSIEIVLTNLINGVFDQVAHVEDGIEAIAGLYNYTKRETLDPLFKKQIRRVYEIFADELQDLKTELIEEKDLCYAFLPYNAGRAWLLHFKKNRLKKLKLALDNAVFIPYCPLKDDVYDQYDKQIKSIDRQMKSIYKTWVESLDSDINDSLNRTLLNRSIHRPGLLECNIDRRILPTCFEASYWEALSFEIPSLLKYIYSNYYNIRLIYEKVLDVILDYNNILAALSDEERVLFRYLLYDLEKKIMPGIMTLTWNSNLITEYIVECRSETSELQGFLEDYKKCSMQIVKICENISSTPLLEMPSGVIFELDDLSNCLYTNINQACRKIGVMHQDIVRYLIVVYEGFETYINVMINPWDRYIRNFDALLEEALRLSVKTSLQNVLEALHGDGTTAPSPLLKVKADLTNNKIDFQPSISDIAKMISNIRPQLIDCLKPFKRLSDKFKVYEMLPDPFYEVIQKDNDCADLQAAVNKEVVTNIAMMQEYIKTWKPYRDIWEVDKNQFLIHYAKQNSNAATFEANIENYTEVINSMQIMETMPVVHFVLVNAGPLKRSITEHCILWQQSLCHLLNKMTAEKIQAIYDYIAINSELIQRVPQNLQELQVSLELYEKLTTEANIQSDQFESIFNQFRTLDKYEVDVPIQVRLQGDSIYPKWQEYLELLHHVDKMINFTKDTFKGKLLDSADELKKDAQDLLEPFLPTESSVPEWRSKDKETPINLNTMKEKLNELRAREAQLKKDFSIFNIIQPDSLELAKLQQALM